jgi:hypothetical protein
LLLHSSSTGEVLGDGMVAVALIDGLIPHATLGTLKDKR